MLVSFSCLGVSEACVSVTVSMPSILIVDDEPGVRSSLSGVLRDEGFDVEAAASGEECLERAARSTFDVVVLDVWLPGIDGLVTLQRLRERKVDAQVVMISGHGNIESAVRAIKMGAFDFVEKPLSLEKTVLVVRNALRQRDLETENRVLRARVDRQHVMVGESFAMRQLREQVEMAAPTNGRVLIYGENGTGKELVARTVHQLSRRRSGPFVEVNCAAIPEELIESELFGHVKGAFTGAVAEKPGPLRAGQRRHDLSRRDRRHEPEDAGQGAARPAGAGDGARRRHAEHPGRRARAGGDQQGARRPRFVRAASARTLYFRLNVIPIFVPPLRERQDDIPLLADHFMALMAAEYGRRPKRMASEAVARLQHYAWPGNVRELRNVIERLMIMVPGDTITAQDLAFLGHDGVRQPASVEGDSLPLADARERFERDYILQALAAQNGNISRTADVLGVERSNLYKKMKAFGIAPVAGIRS